MALCKFTEWECVEKWKHCKALHGGTKGQKFSFCHGGDLSARAILPERTCNCTTEGLRLRTKSTCTVAYIEENEALTGNSIFKLTSPGCSHHENEKPSRQTKKYSPLRQRRIRRIFVTIIYTPSERNVSFFSTTTPRRCKIKTMRVKP